MLDKVNSILKDLPVLYNTYVHDQYLFRNIIFSGDKVCVVDFPHIRHGWPLYDFFSFYTGLDRLKQYPLFTESLIKNMKQCFSYNYFKNSNINLEDEIIENFWALFIISTLKKRYKTPKGVKGFVNRRFIQYTLDKLVEWSKK